MRSAEISGASVTGFGAGQVKADRHSKVRATARNRHFQFTITPLTQAVALTAVIAATLFILHDAARSFDDARRELAIIGSSLARDIAALSPEQADAVLDTSNRQFITVGRASIIPAEVAPQGPMLTGLTLPAQPHGVLALESHQANVWSGILLRGGIAIVLAGLVTLMAARKRRDDMPDLVQRHNYSTLAAAIPLGVACWTRSGKLIVCNEQYRDRLHLGKGNMTYQDAVKKLSMGGYIKLLNDDDGSRVLELHREDGSCLLIDERPLGDGAFMTLISDVTEAKRTDTMLHTIRQEQRLLARRYHEEKLKAEAASRSKTNFLAHLSHDIRTPLNHIIGFAELMRHQTYGPLGDARYADYVQSIKQSGEHLLASFATILDLAELEGGQKPLRSDPVDLDALLDGVVQRFKGQANRAGVLFVLGEHSDAIVQGDQLGLGRMVSNIVENALRFTPSGGQVKLAAFAARDGVVIEVTDTGLGMTEERLASLSQPFALGDATFTREGIGPGLGISISRAIAELSGGHLAIDSTPMIGTTVAISLPLAGVLGMQAAE
ncbi:Signal transduction histidine kinase [Devosia sp. YR412]|uniref:sensor histidine kinase n=1 Tax=Devosia sp. YR412 TaxID=1881030 RepID=UPI0008BEDD30|nr:PAS domain-containing sensor histidine kinase [Devosia sp. YR412]SEP76284.1 Signal transduction histidine kinase [Devosia sp. YR412]